MHLKITGNNRVTSVWYWDKTRTSFFFFWSTVHTARILVGQGLSLSFCLTPPQESVSSLLNRGKGKILKYIDQEYLQNRALICVSILLETLWKVFILEEMMMNIITRFLHSIISNALKEPSIFKVLLLPETSMKGS